MKINFKYKTGENSKLIPNNIVGSENIFISGEGRDFWNPEKFLFLRWMKNIEPHLSDRENSNLELMQQDVAPVVSGYRNSQITTAVAMHPRGLVYISNELGK